MDIVITYVDGLDPQWRRTYSEATGKPVNEKRYRDWGTLRYLMRGIEKHLPDVGKVFLVVSSESQVPGWVNRETVRVVLHSDIIPERFLPVFNSTAIEMFLHRIEGLSEQFLYFNDDFFPMQDCSMEDFFPDGKPLFRPARHLFATNLFKRQVRNSAILAARAAGRRRPLLYVRPQHTCAPMLRSRSEEAYSICREEIEASVTMLRDARNYNQYLFTDYCFYKGLCHIGKISNKHFSVAAASVDSICSFIENPDRKLVCINDVNIPENRYEELRSRILESFERHFPKKSAYELLQ